MTCSCCRPPASAEWRYGHQKDLSLEPGLPLKILSRFEPEASAVLSPGDMLYLPPQARTTASRWATAA